MINFDHRVPVYNSNTRMFIRAPTHAMDDVFSRSIIFSVYQVFFFSAQIE